MGHYRRQLEWEDDSSLEKLQYDDLAHARKELPSQDGYLSDCNCRRRRRQLSCSDQKTQLSGKKPTLLGFDGVKKNTLGPADQKQAIYKYVKS